jgi:serine/threonine-protein kinase HipA
LRIAEVLFKDKPAGTLQETVAGGTRFAYADGWSEEIGCCFPTTRREHEWGNGLHPFFQHIGPEGWLREQQARTAHIDTENDFGLLLAYGADCIGAVGIRPSGPTKADIRITEAGPTPGRTVSGIQKKLLVVETAEGYVPAGPTGPAPFIAKFNSDAIDSLVRNEHRSLSWLAAVLGKEEVTRFALGQVAGDGALIVSRFDRGPKGEKLRLEDCAQILVKPRGRDYEGKYDSSYEEVAAVIEKYSSRPLIDLARFYRRLIAFALVANCDAHIKNFSLLETPTGLRLSPAYDVVNTVIYERFEATFGLAIDGKRRHIEELDGALFRRFGKTIGLTERAVDQTFTDLKRQVEKAAVHIRPPDGEGPDGFVTRFAEIVSNQCLRILGE